MYNDPEHTRAPAQLPRSLPTGNKVHNRPKSPSKEKDKASALSTGGAGAGTNSMASAAAAERGQHANAAHHPFGPAVVIGGSNVPLRTGSAPAAANGQAHGGARSFPGPTSPQSAYDESQQSGNRRKAASNAYVFSVVVFFSFLSLFISEKNSLLPLGMMRTDRPTSSRHRAKSKNQTRFRIYCGNPCRCSKARQPSPHSAVPSPPIRTMSSERTTMSRREPARYPFCSLPAPSFFF